MNNAIAKDDKISNQPGLHGGNLRLARYLIGLMQHSNQEKLEALGQCIPPPRHILPVSRSRSGSVIRNATKI